MPSIGVALSGGGNRASLFHLGVLLYLVDAGKNQEVRSIASVSGGSVTNAYVARLDPFNRQIPRSFHEQVRPLVRRLAVQGTLWAWWGTWGYLGAFVLLACASVAMALLPRSLPCRILFSALLGVMTLVLLGFRGIICGRAFAATLYQGQHRAALLRETGRGDVEHVYCATDLHAGEHVYFSGKFVCAYRFGWGLPGDLPLHVAVQASAAYPLGFPPRVIPTATHEFVDGTEDAVHMVLLDGGVYDNMADQWPMGIQERKRRWPKQATNLPDLDAVIVVNGASNLHWSALWWTKIPIVKEVLSFRRAIRVLYDNTTTPRRRALVARFEAAAKGTGSPRGVLVTLEQSPHDVPVHFVGETAEWPERATRAQRTLEALGNGTRASWADIVQRNASVATTLRSLGSEVSARLLRHGYTTAMTNLHVILDYPLLPIPDSTHFIDLIGQR